MKKGLKLIAMVLMAVSFTGLFTSCDAIEDVFDNIERKSNDASGRKNVKKLKKIWDKEYKDAYDLLVPIVAADTASSRKIVMLCTNDGTELTNAEKKTIADAAAEHNASIEKRRKDSLQERQELQNRLTYLEKKMSSFFTGNSEEKQIKKEIAGIQKRIDDLNNGLNKLGTVKASEIEAEYMNDIMYYKKKLGEYGVVFVDRSNMELVMKEHKFQLSDWSDEKKTAEVGRVLNAEGAVTFTLTGISIGNNVNTNVAMEILNINTMQKTTTESSEDVVSLFTVSDKIPKRIKFDDIMQSAVEYTRESLTYVTPFSRSPFAPKPAALNDAVSQALSGIEEIELDTESKSCWIRFLDGEEESGSLKMTEESTDVKIPYLSTTLLPQNTVGAGEYSARYISIYGDKYSGHQFGIDFNAHNFSFEEFYEVRMATFRIGTVRIRTQSLNLSGNMYRSYYYNSNGHPCKYGDEFVIDFKSDNDDGTGRHYFAFFTVEE